MTDRDALARASKLICSLEHVHSGHGRLEVIAEFIEAARADERERCARICQDLRDRLFACKTDEVTLAGMGAAAILRDAIRAGSPAPVVWTDAQLNKAIHAWFEHPDADHQYASDHVFMLRMRVALEAVSREGK